MLLASFDRWVGALLADDGIDMPFMGGSNNVEATIIARSDGIVVGTAAIDHMLQIWAPSLKITWWAGDGKRVTAGHEIATIQGDREVLLAMERSILNVLGQLSGIATEAKRWSAIAPGQIACTRKTVWGLMDKWAVDLGGCLTHRLNRKDALMLKENDLVAYGDDDISRVQTAVMALEPDEDHAFIEIETTSAKQALAAALAWMVAAASGPSARTTLLERMLCFRRSWKIKTSLKITSDRGREVTEEVRLWVHGQCRSIFPNQPSQTQGGKASA